MTSTDLELWTGGAQLATAVRTDAELIEAFMASPRQASHGTRNRLARARALRAVARFLNCPLIEATTAQLSVWLSRPIADATRISTLSHLHASMHGRSPKAWSSRPPPTPSAAAAPPG